MPVEPAGWPGDTLPAGAMVPVPERHGECAKVPENRPEVGQPMCTEDDVIAGQWQGKEVGGGLAVDGEGSGAVHARARHALPVGHRHLHVATREELMRSACCGFFEDEIVSSQSQ